MVPPVDGYTLKSNTQPRITQGRLKLKVMAKFCRGVNSVDAPYSRIRGAHRGTPLRFHYTRTLRKLTVCVKTTGHFSLECAQARHSVRFENSLAGIPEVRRLPRSQPAHPSRRRAR